MGRWTARAVGFGVVLSLVLSLAPAAAAADLAVFGKPTATSSFTGGVEFSQPVTIDRPLARVELLLTIANSIGSTVIPVDGPSGTGATTLTYHYDQAAGQLTANSRLVARWRLVSADDPTDVLVGPQIALTFADDRFQWQTVAGDLVRVHWYEGPASFGRRALRIGEDAVRKASELLGVTESDPIDFFVYADQDAFYQVLGPGTRENVGGAQIPGLRTMFALIPPSQIDDAWVGTVVPHELTHLVFETAAGNPYHFPPDWLNEGLAVYESEGYGSADHARVEDGTNAGTLIPLEALVGQFPTNTEGFYLAYAESVAAVDYLIRTYGTDALVSLIRSYAQGRTDDEAFSAALGVDMTAFGAAWLKDVGAASPTRHGPQTAPPGPIPAAWLVAAGASAPPAASAQAGAGPEASPAPSVGSPAGDETGVVLVIVLVAGVAIAFTVAVLTSRRRRAGPGSVG